MVVEEWSISNYLVLHDSSVRRGRLEPYRLVNQRLDNVFTKKGST